MKIILVPTDLSANARSAEHYALELAKILNARLVLFHAFELPFLASEAPQPIETFQQIEKENRSALERKVRKYAKVLPGSVDFAMTPVMGGAASEIMKFAKNVRAELIVMGTRGVHNTRLERVFGTVATDLLRRTNIPALVIPENYKFTQIKKAVVGCEGAEAFSSPITKGIRRLTHLFNAELTLLKVFGVGEFFHYGAIIEDKPKLDKKLEGIRHKYAYEVTENSADGLDEYARKEKADLVILLPHSRNFFERIFEGSTTKRMALITKKPLLIMPPKLRAYKAEKLFTPELSLLTHVNHVMAD